MALGQNVTRAQRDEWKFPTWCSFLDWSLTSGSVDWRTRLGYSCALPPSSQGIWKNPTWRGKTDPGDQWHTFSADSGQKADVGTESLGWRHAYEPCFCRERVPTLENPDTRVLQSALPSSRSVTWAVPVSYLVVLPSVKLLVSCQGSLLASGTPFSLDGLPNTRGPCPQTPCPITKQSRQPASSPTAIAPTQAHSISPPGRAQPPRPGCGSNTQLSDWHMC